MAAVPSNTIAVKEAVFISGSAYGPQMLVCGTCGCPVVPEHVATHVAWHALTAANAFPKTVVPNVPAGVA
jgi:hypothetical protein